MPGMIEHYTSIHRELQCFQMRERSVFWTCPTPNQTKPKQKILEMFLVLHQNTSSVQCANLKSQKRSLLLTLLSTLQVYGGPTRLEASEDAVGGIHGEPSLGDARGPGPSEDDIFYRGAFNPVKRAAPKRSRKGSKRKPAIKPGFSHSTLHHVASGVGYGIGGGIVRGIGGIFSG